MSSSLTPGKWAGFLLINVLVTLATMWIFTRVMSQEPAHRLPPVPTVTAAPAAVAQTASNDVQAATTVDVSPAPAVDAPSTSPATNDASGGSASQAMPAASQPTTVKVRISAVQFPGQRTRESVSILNEGDQIDLTGWSIVAPDGKSYPFQNFVLFKDSFITLYSTNGSNSPTSLFWNQQDAVWKRGDTVLLKQGDAVVSTYVVR
jgi:hypothetical protein